MHTSHAELTRDRPSALSPGHARPPVHGSPPPLPTLDVEDGGLGHADDVVELQRELEALRRMLVTLPAIEQAKGVLIGFYAIDADAAFALLVRWSQHTNIKLHLLAADLVAAAEDSSERPHAELRRFINRLPGPGRPSPAAGGVTVAA